MIFKFKQKKVTIDCFTFNKTAYDCFSIKPATQFFPDWWKKYPKTINALDDGFDIELPTIRMCPGIIDLYKQGFIVPIPSDITIRATENDIAWRMPGDGLIGVEQHPKYQYGDTFDDFHHIKFLLKWRIQEKTGVKFNFALPLWNHVDKWNSLIVVPGIIEGNVTAHDINVNSFIRREYQILQFDAGDPLLHITALTDKRLEIKNHLISFEEYNELQYYTFSVNRYYAKMKNFIKQKNKKCPFNHS